MSGIKSSYELAQEQLAKKSPAAKITAAQKDQLAELDKIYAAKIAERELAAIDQIRAAQFAGEVEKADKLREVLTAELQKVRDEKEAKKQAVREAKA